MRRLMVLAATAAALVGASCGSDTPSTGPVGPAATPAPTPVQTPVPSPTEVPGTPAASATAAPATPCTARPSAGQRQVPRHGDAAQQACVVAEIVLPPSGAECAPPPGQSWKGPPRPCPVSDGLAAYLDARTRDHTLRASPFCSCAAHTVVAYGVFLGPREGGGEYIVRVVIEAAGVRGTRDLDVVETPTELVLDDVCAAPGQPSLQQQQTC